MSDNANDPAADGSAVVEIDPREAPYVIARLIKERDDLATMLTAAYSKCSFYEVYIGQLSAKHRLAVQALRDNNIEPSAEILDIKYQQPAAEIIRAVVSGQQAEQQVVAAAETSAAVADQAVNDSTLQNYSEVTGDQTQQVASAETAQPETGEQVINHPSGTSIKFDAQGAASVNAAGDFSVSNEGDGNLNVQQTPDAVVPSDNSQTAEQPVDAGAAAAEPTPEQAPAQAPTPDNPAGVPAEQQADNSQPQPTDNSQVQQADATAQTTPPPNEQNAGDGNTAAQPAADDSQPAPQPAENPAPQPDGSGTTSTDNSAPAPQPAPENNATLNEQPAAQDASANSAPAETAPSGDPAAQPAVLDNPPQQTSQESTAGNGENSAAEPQPQPPLETADNVPPASAPADENPAPEQATANTSDPNVADNQANASDNSQPAPTQEMQPAQAASSDGSVNNDNNAGNNDSGTAPVVGQQSADNSVGSGDSGAGTADNSGQDSPVQQFAGMSAPQVEENEVAPAEVQNEALLPTPVEAANEPEKSAEYLADSTAQASEQAPPGDPNSKDNVLTAPTAPRVEDAYVLEVDPAANTAETVSSVPAGSPYRPLSDAEKTEAVGIVQDVNGADASGPVTGSLPGNDDGARVDANAGVDLPPSLLAGAAGVDALPPGTSDENRLTFNSLSAQDQREVLAQIAQSVQQIVQANPSVDPATIRGSITEAVLDSVRASHTPDA